MAGVAGVPAGQGTWLSPRTVDDAGAGPPCPRTWTRGRTCGPRQPGARHGVQPGLRIKQVSASRTLVKVPMQLSRSFRRREAAGAAGAVASSGRHRVHPPHVPRHGDEAPLALDLVKAAQKELAEAHHRFDDPEHRFRGLACAAHRASCLRVCAAGGSWLRVASGSLAPAVFWQSAPTRTDDAAAGPAQSSERSAPPDATDHGK
jgi:hypothetical protein